MRRSLAEIHKDLDGVGHRSDEEQALLQEVRDARKHDTDEYRTIRKDELKAAAGEKIRLTPEDTQEMGRIVIHKMETGEHQIPVQTGPAPGEIFDQERH